jgi:polar amino acid transport system substrate-binding protein
MKFKSLTSLMAVALGAAVTVTAAAQSGDVLRLGIDPEFPPMEYVEEGKTVGFEVDLANALAEEMKRRIAWTEIGFKGLIPGIISNRFDASISAIYIMPDKEKVISFTDPYFAGGMVTLVQSGSPARKTSDLNGKKVAVQSGTKSVYFMRDNFPQLQLVEVQTIQELFEMVAVGRVDGAVTGKPAALYLAKTRPVFRVLEDQLTTEAYGIAVGKDKPNLVTEFNQALKKIKANGTYARIEQKWFGTVK